MIKQLLKLVFALGLIIWLAQSGKLDFKLVAKALKEPSLIVLCLSLITFQAIISSVRWKILLEVESKRRFPILSMLRLTWIGLFFNSFLPGAVTGDLIKLVYARGLDPDLSRTSLVTSAFLDRLFGLTGLLALMGLFSLFNYTEIIALSAKLSPVIHFNLILFLGAMLVIASLFFPLKGQRAILNLCELIPILGPRLQKTFEKIWLIGAHKKAVFLSLALSLLLQFSSVCAFWLITSPHYSQALPLNLAFTFIPLGLIAIAIPIAPAGLGVGHLAFNTLFYYAGIAQGASLFNLFFLCNLTISLLGVVPYLLSSKPQPLPVSHGPQH